MSNSNIKCCYCGKILEQGDLKFTVCDKCQSSIFRHLEEKNGTHLALFLTCAALNVPCEPEIVPIDLVNYKGDKWARYIDLLSESGKAINSTGDVRSFFSGVCDIRAVFGKELTEKSFARYIAAEQERVSNLPGTEEQRMRWGTGMNYSDNDYEELDRRLANRLEAYKGVTLTPQMQDILIKVCKYDLESDKAVEAGDTKKAKDLFDIVDKALASENMRKKDERPSEFFRIDAQVKALEDNGLMAKGQFMNFEDTVAAVMKNFIKKKKYNYSLDVLDHVIEDMYNGLRANADLSTTHILPDFLKPTDEYNEFAEKETEAEHAAKEYAQLTKVEYDAG